MLIKWAEKVDLNGATHEEENIDSTAMSDSCHCEATLVIFKKTEILVYKKREQTAPLPI